MPFKYLSDVARNDAVVKVIFDNIRNLGLCALVFAAAMWEFKRTGMGAPYGFYFFGSAMLVVGAALTFINYEHGLHKLREMQAPLLVKALLGILYGLLASTVLLYLTQGRTAP